MTDVLVLNASYEPLARVHWHEAVSKIYQGKALIEEAIPDKWIRHKNGKMPWPKVIRYINYVRTPFVFGPEPFTKSGVLKRDKYKCVFCGKTADTVEHILPQSRWPELARDWNNCAAACFRCNNRKGDRTLKEANMQLLYKPWTPEGIRLRGR